jgi:hypothetical protein
MSEHEDHDLFAGDLIWDREREPIEDVDASVGAVSPLCRREREPEDQRERVFELVFELDPEAWVPRLVVVNP